MPTITKKGTLTN